MGTLIGLLTARGWSEGAARAISTIGLVLALAAFCGGVLLAYNHHIIGAHEAKQAASTAIADRKADDHAGDQRRSDDARLTNESTQLERSTDHAQTPRDRELAFQRCLRLQQSARAAKRQPPACG